MVVQVIVVRAGLDLTVGKWCAQAGHAAVSAAMKCISERKEWFDAWFNYGQKKVVLQVDSLTKLKELSKKAKSLGIPEVLIKDAGFTEIKPGTVTCLGLGPAPDELINKVTGSLPLLK